MPKPSIMSTEEWDKFLERLEGPEGCNFQKDEEGKVTWICRGGLSKDHTMLVLDSMGFSLEEMGEIVTFLTLHGGHCDCEVLFNVVEDD